MLVVEVVASVLVLTLGVVTTAMLYVGLLGVVGVLRLVRCERCGHLGVTSPGRSLTSCPRCHHHDLRHPLQARRGDPDRGTLTVEQLLHPVSQRAGRREARTKDCGHHDRHLDGGTSAGPRRGVDTRYLRRHEVDTRR